ncbi:MAG: hypothetical protein HC884_13975, partial [Chloroflexaceae bacterium]|nr:hypothetical protein [Chloroflexaceae bacterium]
RGIEKGRQEGWEAAMQEAMEYVKQAEQRGIEQGRGEGKSWNFRRALR